MSIHRKENGKRVRYAMLVMAVIFAVMLVRELYYRFNSVITDIGGTAVTAGGLVGAIIGVVIVGVSFWLTMVRPVSVDFLIDVDSELSKVSWSTPKELFNNTVVVIVLCLIFGAYIWFIDQGVARIMDFINRL